MRPPARVTQHFTGDYDQKRIQDFVKTALDPLTRNPLASAVLLDSEVSGTVTLDGIAFTAATEKRVAHKLGRKPTYCFPVRSIGTAGATWFESTPADTDYVYLTFSANCTVYLLVG